MNEFVIIFIELIKDAFNAFRPSSIVKSIDKVNDSIQHDTWHNGYTDARECIEHGEDPEVLLNQGRSELYPTPYTYGWKEACKDEISFRKL